MFARRASWDLSPNEVTRRVEERRASGRPVHDLTGSNPTQVGLRAPAEALRAALAALARDGEAARYEPEPRGDAAAREAIASYHRAHGAPLEAEHVLLTAGTSEGYAHLFRLLADPGDAVHLPAPGYGLFEHLAALEGLAVERYPLRPPAAGAARWRIDLGALAAGLGPRSRAVLVIHPHNPTGSFVDPEDLAALRALGRERRVALLSDEVFADAAPPGAGPGSALAGAEQGPLHFLLSGASKPLALPQLKVGWIGVAGPAGARDEALARLEFVADAFLSVSPLAARLLPLLFESRAAVQSELRARVAENRAALGAALRAARGGTLLPAEAGWAALVRFEAPGRHALDEEALALHLVEREGVLVQPGYVFELEPPPGGVSGGYLVLSLLEEPEAFARGAAAFARGVGAALDPGARS